MTNQLTAPRGSQLAPEKDPTDRSILIGIICTLLFHVLLMLLSPQFSFNSFSGVHTGINVSRSKPGKTFDFELAPMTPQEQERKPSQFVETNSAAPDNTPDKTDNFSNRNQQSAQEIAALEKDPENRPSVKGQDKIKSDTIVSGNMAPPQASPPPMPEVTKDEAQERTEQKARHELVPLSGKEKYEGKSEDGVASDISQSKSPTTHDAQLQEGAQNATDPTGGLVAVTQSNHAAPKERPRLSSTSLNRSSPLTNRISGVTNVGIVGRDARWSEYGEYLNELIEIIQVQWYHILEESRVSPPRGTHVIIKFKINSKGETDIVKVEDFDAGKQGVFSCQTAIQARQPYRKWTEQMITVLGEEQTLDFAFYYQ